MHPTTDGEIISTPFYPHTTAYTIRGKKASPDKPHPSNRKHYPPPRKTIKTREKNPISANTPGPQKK